MINAIRRGFNVTRYHNRPTIREETVGHHSANVAALCLVLKPDCSRELLVLALMHDVPEGYTGDTPAPAKWDNPELGAALTEAELKYAQCQDIPWPNVSEEEFTLLKIADMLDLVLRSLEEMRMGNTFASSPYKVGIQVLVERAAPTPYYDKIHAILEEANTEWEPTTSK